MDTKWGPADKVTVVHVTNSQLSLDLIVVVMLMKQVYFIVITMNQIKARVDNIVRMDIPVVEWASYFYYPSAKTFTVTIASGEAPRWGKFGFTCNPAFVWLSPT